MLLLSYIEIHHLVSILLDTFCVSCEPCICPRQSQDNTLCLNNMQKRHDIYHCMVPIKLHALLKDNLRKKNSTTDMNEPLLSWTTLNCGGDDDNSWSFFEVVQLDHRKVSHPDKYFDRAIKDVMTLACSKKLISE